MTTLETKIFLNKIKHSVELINPEAKVYLYGSHARGKANQESDWDILVLTPEKVNFEIEQKYSYPLYDIEWETGEVISVMVRSVKEWNDPVFKITPFYQNVEKDGVML